MTLHELKTLIDAGDVDNIRLYGQTRENKMFWTVAVYGKPSVFALGHCLTNSGDEGYASLDRAYKDIKIAGYQGRFEVDDGSISPQHIEDIEP